MTSTFRILKNSLVNYRQSVENWNYEKIADDLLELSNADHVIINLSLYNNPKIKTLAVSSSNFATRLSDVQVSILEEKEWDAKHFFGLNANLVRHAELHETLDAPCYYACFVDMEFKGKNCYSIGLFNSAGLSGVFTLIMSQTFRSECFDSVELFTSILNQSFYSAGCESKRLKRTLESVCQELPPDDTESKIILPIKDRINDILKSIDDVMCYMDLLTGEHYYGSNAGKMFGYSANEFIEDKDLWWKIIYPEDLEQTIYKYDQLSAINGRAEFEYRVARKDGVEINVYARIKLEKNESNQFVKILGVFSDITGLRNTERRLNHAQSLSKMGSWEFDLRTQDFSWSKQHYELFELTSVPRDKLYEAYRRKILAEDMAKIDEMIDSTIRLGSTYELEFRILCNDGSLKYIFSLGECVKNEKGEVIGLRGTSQDITDRKKIEEKLAHQNKQILEITGAVNQSAMVTRSDFEGTILFANELFRITSGYSKEELIGKNERMLGAGMHSADFWKEFWDTISSGNIWKGEIKNRTKAGKDYWVYTVVNPIKDEKGTIEEYLTIRFDITERKNAEVELNNVKQQIDDIINNVDAGMWSMDTKGNYLFMNMAVEKLTGYSLSEFKAEKNFWQRLFSDDTLKKIKLNHGILKNEGKIEREYELITKSGEKKWVLIKSNLMKDSAGKPVRIDSISTDVTKQIQYKQEIKSAREKAEFANTAKTEFLANISHEIRTPMNAILGFADLLKGKTLSGKYEEYLKGILSGGKSLMLLIDDILDLSKIEAGKMEIQPSAVNVEYMVKELYGVFKQKTQEKNLTLTYHIGASTPKYLLLDEVRLRQILFNLIGNAIKFTDSGEVSIRITSSYSENAHHIKLTFEIIDTGIGIPEDQKEIIFEPFRQMDRQSTKKYGGTGLGLAITRRLVNMMNGKISVSSKVGYGTSFFVSFNEVIVAIDEPKNIQTFEEGEHLEFFGQSVLMVEDVESNREIMRGFLELYNLKITEAENGEVALKILEDLTPHIIFMDVMMPVMDGYMTTLKIKSQKKFEHIPVIAVTAAAMNHTESNIRELCEDYIRKPLSKETLISVLKDHLKHESICTHRTSVSKKPEASESLCKILLIEDNALSQNYVGSALEEAGYAVIIAGTGNKAIIEMTKQQPDLILLDMSLPDMTGEMLYNELLRINPNASITIISGYSKNELQETYPGLSLINYMLKPVSIDDLLEHVGKNIENKFTNTNGLAKASKIYDYSVAQRSARDSLDQFRKWLIQFIDLLNSCEGNLKLYLKDPATKIDHKLLHNLLNYTMQFGAVELKLLIWKLREKQASDIGVVAKDIKNEVELLIVFYKGILNNYD